MNPLLLYFREDFVELWSLDNNGRIIPVLYNSTNKLPLYFLLSGEQILMDNYAKDSYLNCNINSFGDFWKNIDNASITYERFASKNTFDTLLPYALKEAILPSVSKSHFHTNLSNFLNEPNTLVMFDSFVEDHHKEIILKLFFEIIGFVPNSILSIDFFDCFREIQTRLNVINQSESFILTNISDGNFYFHLIGKNSPMHLAKKVLDGKGQDPRIDTILDFLVEIAKAKGSVLNSIEIKKELINDARIILNKLEDGLVIHNIRNDKIDINPLKISFHRNEIESRLSNRQSLNLIQNEFDSFRRQNNAEQVPIFLCGCTINQNVFKEFFKSTYSKVYCENEDFESDFVLTCLNKVKVFENQSFDSVGLAPMVSKTQKEALSLVDFSPKRKSSTISIPNKLAGPPQMNSGVKTPPIINLPPKVTAPSFVTNTAPKVKVPIKVSTPPLPEQKKNGCDIKLQLPPVKKLDEIVPPEHIDFKRKLQPPPPPPPLPKTK